LSGAGEFVHAAGMQGGGSGRQNREGDQIRYTHADKRIEPNSRKGTWSLLRPAAQRLADRLGFRVLDLLRGLPEK
jgi:hypothetical protein